MDLPQWEVLLLLTLEEFLKIWLVGCWLKLKFTALFFFLNGETLVGAEGFLLTGQ